MKLSLTQENLSKALALTGRVVSSRGSLPVLGNVLLTTDANRLRLSATNLEIGINCWIGCKVESDGAITVPARLFSEFVSSLPGGNIELSASELTLNVKTPHYESAINGIAADEFPLIPEIKSEPVLTVPADKFREALGQVVIAASLDESRPVLAGVFLYVEDGNLVVVATDSYRLAEKKIKLKSKEQSNGKLSIIVPARTMQELVRVLAEAEGDMKVFLSDNQVMFEAGSVELTSRLIEGQFPNYRQIIPATIETQFEIAADEFSRITKVASLFARENAGGVRLEVSAGGQVSLVSTASQVGENKSTADCETEGEDNEVSLNARYLSEALAVIKSEQVSFGISGKLNPCVLKPIGNKESDYLHIIMPLRT